MQQSTVGKMRGSTKQGRSSCRALADRVCYSGFSLSVCTGYVLPVKASRLFIASYLSTTHTTGRFFRSVIREVFEK